MKKTEHQSSKLRFNRGPMIDVVIDKILPPKYNKAYKGYQIPIIFTKGYTTLNNKYVTYVYTKACSTEEATDKYNKMLTHNIIDIEVVNVMMPHLNKHPEAIEAFKWNCYRRGYNVRKRKYG